MFVQFIFITKNLLFLPGFEDLRDRRAEVHRLILQEEEEKGKIQKEISSLQDRLNKINESLARKIRARDEYDKTIEESKEAYNKIIESSNALLEVLRRERDTLSKKVRG